MQTGELLLAEDFCTHYRVNISLIRSFHQIGLVELVFVDNKSYVSSENIKKLELLFRLHNELDLNTESLDVVFHLLEKIEAMQSEINFLKGRLRNFEDFFGA